MTRIKIFFIINLAWLVLVLIAACQNGLKHKDKRILVFSKTTGFRHEVIPEGIEALMTLGTSSGFVVDTTEDASNFNEDNLQKYRAIIFLNTTGDIFTSEQKLSFEKYIQAGGGFVGIHSASDTEYNWSWYGKLVGGYFDSHPEIQSAIIHVKNRQHPSTQHLPEKWERRDEWYNFKDLNSDVNVLAVLDESSYKGGTNQDHHPIAWYHEYDGGRAFYTGGGHTSESFKDPVFLQHILGGIEWAAGDNKLVDGKVKNTKVRQEDTVSEALFYQEGGELRKSVLLKDGRTVFVEPTGTIKIHDPETNQASIIASLPVAIFSDDANPKKSDSGLLGIVLDKDYESNHFIYLLYSPMEENPKNLVSRFILKGDFLDTDSEVILKEIPVAR